MIAALRPLVRPIAGLFGPDEETLPTWLLLILTALALWGTYALVKETADRIPA